MGHADPDPSYHSGATADKGFRASSYFKRRSLFGRPESMSSFVDVTSAALTPPPQVAKPPVPAATAAGPMQGILYHNLPEQHPPPQTYPNHERASATPVQQKRRSIFGIKLGSKKEEQPAIQFEYQQPPRRDPPPQYSDQLAQVQYVRGPPLPVNGNNARGNYYMGEPEYYQAQKKATISAPYNFQHVSHTHKKHLPALETVDEKGLNRELWAASTYQVPRQQSRGPPVYERSVPHSAEALRPITPGRSNDRARAPSAGPFARVKSTSREDITALPGFGSSKKDAAPRKHDVNALLGLIDGKPEPKAEPIQKQRVEPRRSESARPREKSVTRPRNESGASLLGFDFGLRAARSQSTQGRQSESRQSEASRQSEPKRTEQSFAEDGSAAMLGFGWTEAKLEHKRAEKERKKQEKKASMESNRISESSSSNKGALSVLTGGKDRTQSESSFGSSIQKRDDINALLGLSTKETKRQSKRMENPQKQNEVNALLGIRSNRERSQSRHRQVTGPLRPQRSDEAMKARNNSTPSIASSALVSPPLPSPSAHSPGLSVPERPKRANENEQFLRDMGFAQLLYRPNSNESRHSPNTSISSTHFPPRRSEDRRSNRISVDAESVYPQEVPEYPGLASNFDNVAEDVERNVNHHQQVRYRSKQPLPSLPEQYVVGQDGRTALQTVRESSEHNVSPLQSPADSAVSPVSPVNSARMLSPKSPELTGPGMPDDETWMDEIDFLYKQHAEATNDFDWDNVSMTPHRLSNRDDKRLSLNIPSLNVPGVAGLQKKLSEGSLRQSAYVPSSRTSKDLQYIYRDFHNRKYVPQESRLEEDTQAGARVSPEVRVVDVDDHQAEPRQQHHDVSPLHMHGYESIAAGYLSDPESLSTQHRQSNSYGSWESRRSGMANKDQPVRLSMTSNSSVPDLLQGRRGPKPAAPVTVAPQSQPQYQEPPAQQSMHDYSAFGGNPYANGDSRPPSSHYNPVEVQHYPMPTQSVQQQLHRPSHVQTYTETKPAQAGQQREIHHHHYYYGPPPQNLPEASDYLSMRRPETIDENAVLRAAGDVVKNGRAESRGTAGRIPYTSHPQQQQEHHHHHHHQQPQPGQGERVGWF